MAIIHVVYFIANIRSHFLSSLALSDKPNFHLFSKILISHNRAGKGESIYSRVLLSLLLSRDHLHFMWQIWFSQTTGESGIAIVRQSPGLKPFEINMVAVSKIVSIKTEIEDGSLRLPIGLF
jgi:hypothetical protein